MRRQAGAGRGAVRRVMGGGVAGVIAVSVAALALGAAVPAARAQRTEANPPAPSEASSAAGRRAETAPGTGQTPAGQAPETGQKPETQVPETQPPAAGQAPEPRQAPPAGQGLEAGLWRSLQTATINGMTAPLRESNRCLRAADVADLDRTFSPVFGTTNSACERVEHDFTPQRLRWRLVCRGQVDQEVAGEFRFERRDRYTATIHAQFLMLGKLVQEVVTTIEAERVGDCQPGP